MSRSCARHVHPFDGVRLHATGAVIHDRVRRPDRDVAYARLVGTLRDAIVHVRALAEAGLQYFMVGIGVGIGSDEETLRLLGTEALAAFA